MPYVKFVVDNVEEVIDAREGQTLMRVAVEHGIPGIVGECGGEMTCGTCHVWLEGSVADAVPARDFDEEDMLEVVEHLTSESRLGCQVTMTAELDGLIARIPGE